MIGQQAVVTQATRGPGGPGEVTIAQGGGTEVYIAWSTEPLPKGTPVVIYAIRGARTVDVESLTSGG
jgi:membrane protein implicated in regulation of membrane protease activity